MAKPAPSGQCPICGKPTEPKTRPFCSVRCADVDLGRWFGEAYRVAAAPRPDDADTAEEEEDD
jgi:endogenous inhibitor of DNA gyrase (YacG/DUF329 family)